MVQGFYGTIRFARKAAVSVRTLRYYDKVGLLAPTSYTEAGHRLYTDHDLVVLQQILALKFLGFSLHEIRACLQTGPHRLQEVFARQKAMLMERRAQLDTIIQAVAEAERLAEQGQQDWAAIVHLIEVLQMDQTNDWRDKYFSPDQQQQMQELSEHSYNAAAREQMDARPAWTEQDQRRVDEQYARLASGLKALVAEGADPADPRAQELAQLFRDLIHGFTQGDENISAGLNTWWQNWADLPAAQRPPALPWGAAEQAFLERATAINDAT